MTTLTGRISIASIICSAIPILLATAACSRCDAQLNRIKPPYNSAPLKGTPLDPRTLLPRSKESTSSLQVVQPPWIDENGNVWPGSSNTGDRPSRPVAKAKIAFPYNTTDAWWVSDYRNALGKVAPRRAPRKYDRTEVLGKQKPGESTAGTSGKIETESGSSSIRTEINPATGQVVRRVLRNGSVKSATVIGQANLQTSANGQRRWVYGSQSVAASQQNSSAGKQTPEEQLAIGILQILDAAAKKKKNADKD